MCAVIVKWSPLISDSTAENTSEYGKARGGKGREAQGSGWEQEASACVLALKGLGHKTTL